MINKVTLLGNLGKDPEVKETTAGQVTILSVATSEKWTDKEGQKQESTEWHTVVLWNNLADIAAKHLKKGGRVYIEGKLNTRQYEKEGDTKYYTEIIGRHLVLL